MSAAPLRPAPRRTGRPETVPLTAPTPSWRRKAHLRRSFRVGLMEPLFRRLEDSSAMPSWLEEWMTLVLSDLQGRDPVVFGLGLVEYAGLSAVWHLDEDGGQQIYSEEEMAFTPDGTPFHRDRIAERLQEAFLESAAYGQARPPCPGHRHPAQYRNGGTWCCPDSGAHLGTVGALST